MSCSRSFTPKSRCRSVDRLRKEQSSRASSSPGLRSPVLGKNFSIPDLYRQLAAIELDETLPYVPVYTHFVLPEIQPVVRPTTPPILTALRAEFGESAQWTKSPKPHRPDQRSRNSHHGHHHYKKDHKSCSTPIN